MKRTFWVAIILGVNIPIEFSQIIHHGVGLIPQNCQVQWTNAGLLSTTPKTARLWWMR